MASPETALELDAAVRLELGLADGENVHVIHRAGSLISLERTGADTSRALPWDRDLVLTADVRAFPIADLLSLIHTSGKSGFLLLSCGADEKQVYFHRGEVVFAASNQRVDRLGECLLREGVITIAQLREAESRWTPETRFGKVLVQLGLLTPRDLWNAVKTQVEEIVRSLFAYTAGTVHVWAGEIQPDNVVRLALPTNRLVADGLKRRDELFKFLAYIEDTNTRLIPADSPDDRLSNSELEFLEALAEVGVFGAACRRAGIDPLSGARTVQLLQLVGSVKVERSEAVPGATPSEVRGLDDDPVREAVYDHVKLLAELAAPIVAVDGTDAVKDRFGRIVVEAAERHRLLADVEVGPGGAIDPELLVGAALRLTGDRVRGVSDALGELVAYLEFELNNHPRIEGAEMFLDAVEALRAKIER